MTFNEDTRVKIPAAIHLLRLDYTYRSKKEYTIDCRNNIFIEIFKESIERINRRDFSGNEINELLKEIEELTENKVDKGKSFYERLTKKNGIKLIDFENIYDNDFSIVTELTYSNKGKEFRPDNNILINGIPIAFVEVKKPNNLKGMEAEFNRMDYRFKQEEFMPYFNQLQVICFSNNMKYNDEERIKLQGNFYSTPNGIDTSYNLFREEELPHVNPHIEEEKVYRVLKDNGLLNIINDKEFETNMNANTPLNSFETSMFTKERLIYFIQYGITYVDSLRDGFQKHIMRYPQFFASKKILEKIEDKDMERGVIWHTQGSGKTALSYYSTRVLKDYYQKKGTIVKFYFIVDRLDLLIQASGEFSSRGLSIAEINSKDDFIENIKSVKITTGNQRDEYKGSINVVNIQKFSEESQVEIRPDLQIQRIYFLDEVHRGYKPKGTFLANLLAADPNGIFIGLTGTPLLSEDVRTVNSSLFHQYIHKYYYNKSIADGYTLRIKKENIATQFRNKVSDMLKKEKGKPIPAKDWDKAAQEDNFIKELGKYIDDDFAMFKNEIHKDNSLGFMIISTSSTQAKKLKEWFDENSSFKMALVLYDQENNSAKQNGFRGIRDENNNLSYTYDGVIVYSMLLTGFDAPRLKKIYLLRKIKEHSLLQTLARVNRPYKSMKYGYVVDFVDITEEYEETNKRYMKELKADMFDEFDEEDVKEIFVNPEDLKKKIDEIENRRFNYIPSIMDNLEDFRISIENLDEKNLREFRKDLEIYQETYNELRSSHEDIEDLMPIDRVITARREVDNRIKILTAERALDNPDEDIDDFDFSDLIVEFFKTDEIDLTFIAPDDILEIYNKVRNQIHINNDKDDEKYKNIVEDLKFAIKDFKKTRNTESAERFKKELQLILKRISILNTDNDNLSKHYGKDIAFMKIHKRLREKFGEELKDKFIKDFLNEIINALEEKVEHMQNPSEPIIKAQIKRPAYKYFKSNDIKIVDYQLEKILNIIVRNKYMRIT